MFFGTNRPACWPPSVDQGARATTPANSMVVTRGGNDPRRGRRLRRPLRPLQRRRDARGTRSRGLLLNPVWRGFIRQARNTQGDQLAELLGGAVYGFEPTYGLRGGWSAGANVTEGFAGDFSQMIIAIREDLNWLISREAVITDSDGKVLLNLFQQDSVALRVVFRVAMQIAQPVTPEVGVKASRYPFAVIQGTGAVAYDEDAETPRPPRPRRRRPPAAVAASGKP